MFNYIIKFESNLDIQLNSGEHRKYLKKMLLTTLLRMTISKPENEGSPGAVWTMRRDEKGDISRYCHQEQPFTQC